MQAEPGEQLADVLQETHPHEGHFSQPSGSPEELHAVMAVAKMRVKCIRITA
jgi:hypothetical protein